MFDIGILSFGRKSDGKKLPSDSRKIGWLSFLVAIKQMAAVNYGTQQVRVRIPADSDGDPDPIWMSSREERVAIPFRLEACVASLGRCGSRIVVSTEQSPKRK